MSAGFDSIREDPGELFNASHEHRCIFIHVPKTAGTSIKTVFHMEGGGHLTWLYYALYFPLIWQQYTSFAVVRNPWDRAVSAYHFATMKESFWHTVQVGPPADYALLSDKSFEECLTILHRERERLKSESWHEQTYSVARPQPTGTEVMVDRLLRYENLDAELSQFCAELSVPLQTLPKLNCSNRGRDYRKYYNDATRRMIEIVYASDIETFGYSF